MPNGAGIGNGRGFTSPPDRNGWNAGPRDDDRRPTPSGSDRNRHTEPRGFDQLPGERLARSRRG
jgi:hypothetical protein